MHRAVHFPVVALQQQTATWIQVVALILHQHAMDLQKTAIAQACMYEVVQGARARIHWLHHRYNCRHRARRHTIHAPVPRAILAIVNQPIGPAMAVHKPARSKIVIATVNVYPPQNVDAMPDTMAMVSHVHGVPRARHRPGPPASLDAVSRPGQVDRIPQDRTGTHPSVVINHQH